MQSPERVAATPTAIAIIPARLASTRLPRKVLLDRTGKPLIEHVVEQARQAERVRRVIVATDDAEVAGAVRAFGGEVVFTRSDHPNGTSRLAEVVAGLPADEFEPACRDIVVNVQGDEPEIEPAVIDALIAGFAADPDAPMATLASPFADDEDPANPSIVKLITNQRGRAMYFSRSLIPFDRDKTGDVTPLKHPGLYAYSRDFLLRYVELLPTPLEQAEKLEQLRALEHGYAITVVPVETSHHGIDTPEQYESFVARHQRRAGAS